MERVIFSCTYSDYSWEHEAFAPQYDEHGNMIWCGGSYGLIFWGYLIGSTVYCGVTGRPIQNIERILPMPAWWADYYAKPKIKAPTETEHVK